MSITTLCYKTVTVLLVKQIEVAIDLIYYIVIYLVMIRLNIFEAKTHLSRYLGYLAKGQTIVLCKRNKPFAEIRPLAPESHRPRAVGWAKGEFKLSPEFFKPLPGPFLRHFQKE